MNAHRSRLSSTSRATAESSCPCPGTAAWRCSRAARPRMLRPSSTSRTEYSIPLFGPAKSDTDLAEQVHQPPCTRGQSRVIGLELNRDSFQTVGKRSVRRGRHDRGLVDQVIDVLHQVAQAIPGLGVLPKGLRQFPV